MKEHIKNRLKRTGILCMVALIIGAAIGWVQAQNGQSGPRPVAGIKIGGPFTLTDQNGHTVTEKDLAGHYNLIYFGFTSCPAICPTELAKIVKALKILEHMDSPANVIQPVFITVDPGRDTPEMMKQYLTLFDAPILGLTGTQAQIDTVLKEYKIFAAKRQEPGASDYTMDHSSFIYFIDPQGALLSIFRTEDTAETMVKELQEKM